MFKNSTTTIHTTHVQEPGRKDVDVYGSGQECEGKCLCIKFNLESSLQTVAATQGYHRYRYIVKAHEVSESQLARGRASTLWA